MIRSIFWKEFREQRLIAAVLPALAFVTLALLGLFGRDLNLSNDDVLVFKQTVAITIAIGCALVTGAMHWAAEKENGTLALLDLQPKRRRDLWNAKTAYAVAQWAVQTIVVALIALLLRGVVPSDVHRVILFGIIALWSFGVLAWSIYASSRTRTPLSAMGWGMISAIALPWITLFVAHNLPKLYFFERWFGSALASQAGFYAAVGSSMVLVILPLVLSFRKVTEPDRLRLAEMQPGMATGRFQAFRTGWKLAGVDVKNLAWPVVICLGVHMFVLSMEPTMLWLIIGSLAGLFLGVSVTDMEHNQGAFKLWADQRLPLGKLWGAKVFNRLLTLVGVTFAAIASKAAAIYFFWDNSPKAGGVTHYTLAMFIGQVTPTFALIAIAPLTGFAVGLLMSLVMRKKIIALFAGGFLALVIMIFWMPMIGSGGLRFWQWAGVPITFSLAAWLLVRPWATGQLGSRKLLAGIVAPLLFTGVYWFGVEQYRIRSIPKAGPLFDIEAYENETATTEASQAADRLREIAKNVERLKYEWVWNEKTTNIRIDPTNAKYYQDRMSQEHFLPVYHKILNNGWENAPRLYRSILKTISEGDWVAILKKMEGVELAVLEFPQGYTQEFQNFREGMLSTGMMLAIDALRLQSEGKTEQAEERLKQAFQLSRITGRHSMNVMQINADGIEREALRAMLQYSESMNRKSDLPALRKLIALLDEQLAKRPTAEEQLKFEYLARMKEIRNMHVYWQYADNNYERWSEKPLLTRISTNIWFNLIQSRYESQRRKAIFDAWMAGVFKASQADYPTLVNLDIPRSINAHGLVFHLGSLRVPVTDWISPELQNPSPEANLKEWSKIALPMSNDIQLEKLYIMLRRRAELTGRAYLELMKVALAVRGHRIEHGAYPKSLDALAPDWFKQVPVSPLTLQPFAYELADGKAILRADDPAREKADRHPEALQFPLFEQQKTMGLVLPAFEVKEK